MDESNNKKFWVIPGALALAGLLAYFAYSLLDLKPESEPPITSFEECVEAGYPTLDSYPPQCETPERERFQAWTLEDDWKVVNDSDMTFAYPATWVPDYVEAVDWPPSAQIVNEPFGCTEAGTPADRAGQTDKINVEGKDYCRTTILEGAAGSVYGQYAYAFPADDRTAILTFGLRFVQCENYDEPQQQDCFDDQEAFNIDRLIHQMAQTIILAK